MKGAPLAGTLVAVALAYLGAAHATEFGAETIVLDGREHTLHSAPLDPWLRRHPGARQRLATPPEGDAETCAGDTRGYMGTFAIAEGRLWLRHVRAERCYVEDTMDGPDLVPQLFRGRTTVPATWFSGILVVPMGEWVQDVHMDYGTLYPEYRLFRVERGRVTDEARMDLAQYGRYRDAQFRAWQRTRDYRRRLAALMQPDAHSPNPSAERVAGYLYGEDVDYTMRMMLPFDVADAPTPEVPQ